METCYPTLVADKYGELVGDVATSWKSSKAGKVWTFKLEKAGWSDGKPITARDVAFTFTTAKKHTNAGLTRPYPGITDNIIAVRALGKSTVVITLKQSSFEMPALLNESWIVPQHVYGVGGATADSIRAIGNSGPQVCGGPYAVSAHSAGGTSVLFKANKYWTHGKVATPNFGMAHYGTDDALLLALRSNEIDVAPAFFSPVTAGTLPSNVKLLKGPSSQLLPVVVNLADSDHPELRSPVVRKALSVAINRNQIANLGYGGNAVPESSPNVFTSVKPWHNTSLKPDPYAPAQANAMLDRLGFRRGSDGTRVANGHKMSYEFLEMTGLAASAQSRALLQQYMKAIGVEITPKALDGASFNAQMASHKWTLAISTTYGGANGLYYLGVLNSESTDPTWDTGWKSAKYDALWKKLNGPGVTSAAAKQIIDQMQVLAAASRPIIPIVNAQTVALARSNVSGVRAWIFGAPNPRYKEGWAQVRVTK